MPVCSSSRLAALLRGAGAVALVAGLAMPLAARASAPDDTTKSYANDDEDAGVRIRGGGVTVTVDDPDAKGRRIEIDGPRIRVDDGEVVRLFSDVEIDESERIDGDVVTVFGSSRIDGHVTGNAIAVFGSVTLGPRAAVDGDLVAVFGIVDRPEGATVGGETVDLGFSPLFPGLPALPTILLMVGMLWLFSLIGGWIVSLIMPRRLVRITATASRRMGASLLLGLATIPALIMIAILLGITVIGIPIVILLPFAFGFVMWIGQYAGLYGLGLKLLRRRIGEGPVFPPLALGTLLIAGFFVMGALLATSPGASRTLALFLVAVGGLICLALQVIGCGAVLLSRFGTRPRDLEPVAELVPPVHTPAPAAPPVGA